MLNTQIVRETSPKCNILSFEKWVERFLEREPDALEHPFFERTEEGKQELLKEFYFVYLDFEKVSLEKVDYSI